MPKECSLGVPWVVKLFANGQLSCEGHFTLKLAALKYCHLISQLRREGRDCSLQRGRGVLRLSSPVSFMADVVVPPCMLEMLIAYLKTCVRSDFN